MSEADLTRFLELCRRMTCKSYEKSFADGFKESLKQIERFMKRSEDSFITEGVSYAQFHAQLDEVLANPSMKRSGAGL